jgi:AraC-like DNA-binding protein
MRKNEKPNIDLEYISSYIAQLWRIPTRIYQDEERQKEYFTIPLKKDPFEHTAKELLKTILHIDYIITKYFELYGIVSDGHTAIVLGPVGFYQLDSRLLDEYSFLIGIRDNKELDEHLNALKSITALPLEFFMHILCFLNYFVNREKLTPVDVLVSEKEQKQLAGNVVNKALDQAASEEKIVSHDTYDFEQTMLSHISTGNVAALQDLLKSSAPIGGTLSRDFMLQDKFMFIAILTQVGRAAIRGGLEPQEALQLCDVYSLQCERLNSTNDIKNLEYRLVMDFTERVASLRLGSSQSPFVHSIANFIQKNMTRHIKGLDIAAHVHMSRPAMCKKFKAETNQTVSEYHSVMRIAEAKRLLRYTDKSLSAIANHLCYSSQSHFQNSFKKAVGVTPVEYRSDPFK